MFKHTFHGDDDYEFLSVNVTSEGIILDAYKNDDLVATMGMTFGEWFNHVRKSDPLGRLATGEVCPDCGGSGIAVYDIGEDRSMPLDCQWGCEL